MIYYIVHIDNYQGFKTILFIKVNKSSIKVHIYMRNYFLFLYVTH